jgi:hypothetical protein
MFGTIRKHSTWLWVIIIVLTVISFIYWGAGPGSSLDRAGGGQTTLGSINGEAITVEDFRAAQREVYLQFYLRHRDWPDRVGKRVGFDEEKETYLRLLIIRKLEELWIHPSSAAVAKTASQMLRSMNGGNPFPLDQFVKQHLAPKLTTKDFENYLRHELGIQQLIAVTGLSGELVTPQEVRALYTRENEELSVQAVFFSASNYLAGIAVTPEALQQFYTNNMPRYRLPERLQLSYVKFLATNFWEEAGKDLNQITNLNEQLDLMYQQRKTNIVNATLTPEEFKANILKEEQRKMALLKARKQANAFATELFDLSPVQADNLEKLAQTKGLTVEVTQPFSRVQKPTELQVGEDFAEKAFKLTAAEPFSGDPILGFDEAYVVALKAHLPSENPPYESVLDRVTENYRYQEALRAAHQAGQVFYATLTNEMAAGKGFVAICAEAKLQPVLPPAFSPSTRELPEIEQHVNLQQFKQATFTATIGKPTGFMPTREGGFIAIVLARLPLDTARMNAALTNFSHSVRQARQNEAFNDWFQAEAKRGLSAIPYFNRQQQPPADGGMPPAPPQ